MRIFLIAAALLAAAAPALADTAGIHEGQVVRDANNVRLGTVDRVSADGVRIIFGARIVTIPAATVTAADGKTSTSLTRAEVAKLK